MNKVQQLILEVAEARKLYIRQIDDITEVQAQWKSAPEVWNIIENTEHLFWAEHGGIVGMWKTLHAIRDGKMESKLEPIHQDMPIEKVIDLTWKPKELVPPVAAPRMGGPLVFWKLSLISLQELLDAFGNDLKENELRLQAHPHPISGALDFQQRIEFLKFHIDRHRGQVAQIISDSIIELK